MSAKSDDSKDDLSGFQVFTGILDKYKELFAAIFFFVGGAIWIFQYFATKDELKSLREITAKQNNIISCLLDRHVQALEDEFELKNDQDQLSEIMTEIDKLNSPQGRVTDFDIRNRAKFRQQKEDLDRRIADAEKAVSDARKAIMYRSCEQ